jgi:hypothetical protein
MAVWEVKWGTGAVIQQAFYANGNENMRIMKQEQAFFVHKRITSAVHKLLV